MKAVEDERRLPFRILMLVFRIHGLPHRCPLINRLAIGIGHLISWTRNHASYNLPKGAGPWSPSESFSKKS